MLAGASSSNINREGEAMPEYFTLDEFRDLTSMQDSAKYPDATVERAAAYIVAVIERVVGTSFVPRTFTKTLSGTGSEVVLPSTYILEVTGVSVGGDAQAGPFLVDNGSLIGAWPRGTRNVTVTYSAGYSETPPADIKEAAMQGTRARVLDTASNSQVNDRTSQMTNEAGGTTTFVLPGVDRPTGYPDVDAVILGWRRRLFGLGFI